MSANIKPQHLIPYLVVIGMIAISFSAIFVRWSAAPASVIAMYRLLLTNVCMLPFIWRHVPEMRSLRPFDSFKLAASGAGLGLHFMFWMDSLNYTTVASSTAILTLEPILVTIGAYVLFRQKTGFVAQISMTVAIVGAVCIGWGDFRFSGSALHGDLLSFLSTVAVAVHMLLGKSLRARISAFVYSFFVFLYAGGVLLVYNVIGHIPLLGYPAREWGNFLLLAIVPTVFGHYIFNWLLKYMKTASVSMIVLGEPLGATLLAYVLLGERVTLLQLGAGAMLLVGVAVFLRSSEGEEPPAEPEAQPLRQAD